MEKYYGLRLIRILSISASIVISIFTIGAIGALGIPTLTEGLPFDAVQGLTILTFGGIISLFLYAFAQLTDLQIKNYHTSYRVLRQTAKSNELNTKILDLLEVQLEIMRLEFRMGKDNEINLLIKQIEARRKRLEKPS